MAEIEDCIGEDCIGCDVCLSGSEFDSIIDIPAKPWYLLEGEDYDLWEGFDGLE